MPEISVISTVYNGEKYLDDYFLSMANQTFDDYELIIINDGSTDESGRICEEYTKKDSRIKLFHQNNQGLAAARNNAVGYASADWIAFVDCDDMIHPKYLEILYEGVKQQNVLISGASVLEFANTSCIKTKDVDPVWKKYDVSESFLMGDLCSSAFGQIACAKLINKKLLINNLFTNGRIFEDNAVVKKWIYYAGSIVFTESYLYYYRINNSGLSKSTLNAKKVEDVLWSRDEIIDFYKQKGLRNAYIEAERSYILFAASLYHKLRKVDRRNAYKLKKKTLKRYNEDKSFVVFSKKNKLFVFEMKYPKLMWLYWKIKGIM